MQKDFYFAEVGLHFNNELSQLLCFGVASALPSTPRLTFCPLSLALRLWPPAGTLWTSTTRKGFKLWIS